MKTLEFNLKVTLKYHEYCWGCSALHMDTEQDTVCDKGCKIVQVGSFKSELGNHPLYLRPQNCPLEEVNSP